MTTAAGTPPAADPVTPPATPPPAPPVAPVTPPATPPVVPPAATPPAAPAATPPAVEPPRTDAPPPAAAKAPDKYTLVVSEKAQTHVSAADLQSIEAMARANNWSNADAQAALDEHVSVATAVATANRARLAADPEYGGDRLAETDRLARLAINRIRPEGHPRRGAFFAEGNRGGAFDNPEFASFLADVGSQMAEDRPVRGVEGRDVPVDAAEVLYGKTTPAQ